MSNYLNINAYGKIMGKTPNVENIRKNVDASLRMKNIGCLATATTSNFFNYKFFKIFRI